MQVSSHLSIDSSASPSPPDASTGKPVWRCNRAASSIDALAPVNTTMACAVFACDAEKDGLDRSNNAANNKLPDLLMKNMAQTVSATASTQQIFKSPVAVMRSLKNFIQRTFDKTIILPICRKYWRLNLTNSWQTSTRHCAEPARRKITRLFVFLKATSRRFGVFDLALLGFLVRA